MEKKELVSVILPTYNSSLYLGKAIDSVLSQTFVNYELLILDNNSTDDTQDIVASYSDKRIQYIRHSTNIGLAANWLYGVNLARGKYFCILGSDDYYLPTFLEDRVRAFKQHDGIVAVFSDQDECDESGEVTPSSRVVPDKDCLLTGELLLATLHQDNRIWSTGSTLFKTHPVRQWWNTAIRSDLALDTAISILIACKSSALFIKDKGLIYRRHKNQISNTAKLNEILFGHFNAYFEPFVLECATKLNFELSQGIVWSINMLVVNALSEGNIEAARKLSALLLWVDFFSWTNWKLFIKVRIPSGLTKSTASLGN